MSHVRQIPMDERRIILNLHNNTAMTPDEIGENVNRVRGAVHNVIKDPNKQNASPTSGRPRTLSQQDIRNMMRKARKGNFKLLK